MTTRKHIPKSARLLESARQVVKGLLNDLRRKRTDAKGCNPWLKCTACFHRTPPNGLCFDCARCTGCCRGRCLQADCGLCLDYCPGHEEDDER